MPTGRGKKKTVASELELENAGRAHRGAASPGGAAPHAQGQQDEASRHRHGSRRIPHGRGGQISQEQYRLGARAPRQCARAGALRRRSENTAARAPASRLLSPARGAREAVVESRRVLTAACRTSTCPAGSSMRPRRLKDWLVEQARADLDACVGAARQKARRESAQHHAARPDEPLGLVHGWRAAVVFVAAGAGACACARLRRRARGCASGRDEPRSSLLEAGRALHAAAG